MSWLSSVDVEARPRDVPWATGRFYGFAWADSFTSSTQGGTNLLLVPIYVPNIAGVTVTSIGIEVVTGGTSSIVRLGIYKATSEGLPGALLLDAGTVATTSSATFASIVVNQFLPQGWYFLASVHAAPSVFPAVRRINAILLNRLGVDAIQTTTYWLGYQAYASTTNASAAANNGLPSHFPIWSGAVLPNTASVIDRVLVGI